MSDICNYVVSIQQDYADYKKDYEGAINFGMELEMADIHHNANQLGMRVVPVSEQEFKMLRSGACVSFLSAFGIRRANKSGKG